MIGSGWLQALKLRLRKLLSNRKEAVLKLILTIRYSISIKKIAAC
jgi:hypothetical protein